MINTSITSLPSAYNENVDKTFVVFRLNRFEDITTLYGMQTLSIYAYMCVYMFPYVFIRSAVRVPATTTTTTTGWLLHGSSSSTRVTDWTRARGEEESEYTHSIMFNSIAHTHNVCALLARERARVYVIN